MSNRAVSWRFSPQNAPALGKDLAGANYNFYSPHPMPLRTVAALLLALAVSLPAHADDAVATAQNRFAAALFRQLATQPGNVFVSPTSLQSVLSLAAIGARGKTASELAAALHLAPADLEKSGDLLRTMSGGKSAELSIANAVWSQKGLGVRPEFARSARRFDATAEEVDFLGHPDAARRAINAWVGRATRSKIPELIPQGGITEDQRLVLTNAIYFKAAWQSPFEKKDTVGAPFKLADGQSVNVPTMKQEDMLPFAKGSGFRAVKLPYKGGALSLVVLLPNSARDLARLEKNLPTSLPAFTDREVDLALPRFRIADERELSVPLKALGVSEAFSPRADFSAMLTGQAVALSSVIHKAVVEVNEEGTEASAASALMVLAAAPPEEVVEFHVDRPFLFQIRHEKTGAILFAGRVSDPRGK